MSKIEITDEMISTFKEKIGWASDYNGDDARIRRALNAALNPPPEPEIVVTEEMQFAAENIPGSFKSRPDYCAAIYRAMYAARPKEVAEPTTKVPGYYTIHHRVGDGQFRYGHRRKGE